MSRRPKTAKINLGRNRHVLNRAAALKRLFCIADVNVPALAKRGCRRTGVASGKLLRAN